MRNTSTILSGTLAVLLALSLPALAQSAGPNGGLVAGKDGHETELIISPAEITVFLLHKDKPQATKNAAIRLVVQQAGKNTTVQLKDAGGKLTGKLDAPLSAGAIVVITGKDDHGHAVSSRYVIK